MKTTDYDNSCQRLAMNIAAENKYVEASGAIKHFSGNVFRIRALAIAQGFAILAGSALLTKEGLGVLSVMLGGFGLLLTRVLSKLHDNYLNFLLVCFAYAKEMENGDGPWGRCLEAREKFLKDSAERRFVERGPFYLMYLALAAMALYNLFSVLM